MSDYLKGGTFNLKFGRDKRVVAGEVVALMEKHGLDFLCLHEARDYQRVLSGLAAYEFFCADPSDETSDHNNGILVRRGVTATSPRYGFFGDGWWTVRGGRHRPKNLPRVTLAGWLRVAAVHMPTPSKWVGNDLQATPEREDDYLDLARRVLRFMVTPWPRARVVAGDWNEPPGTTGTWSPGWIARKAGAAVQAPASRSGHGHIDYPMWKGCTVTDLFKDLKILEGSDHEPVLFTVHRPAGRRRRRKAA